MSVLEASALTTTEGGRNIWSRNGETFGTSRLSIHKRLKYAIASCARSALRQPDNMRLIFVIGPTGVGKTSLLPLLRQELARLADNDLAQASGCHGLATMTVPVGDMDGENWREYYLRSIEAVTSNDAKDNRDNGTDRPDGETCSPMHSLIGQRTEVLRHELERKFDAGRTRVLALDDAQHFLLSRRRPRDRMIFIGNLASTTGVVHLLLGTYDALPLTSLPAHLLWRSPVIHFPRYRREHAADWGSFHYVLRTIQEHMPFQEPPDLVSRIEYFYTASLGCVGILVDGLRGAVTDALADGCTTLPWKYIERWMGPGPGWGRLAYEIQGGEREMEAWQEHHQRQMNDSSLN